jgi:hypothetical protein
VCDGLAAFGFDLGDDVGRGTGSVAAGSVAAEARVVISFNLKTIR